MNKDTIKGIRPTEVPKVVIKILPGDRPQSSIPRSSNVPPPPKPKK